MILASSLANILPFSINSIPGFCHSMNWLQVQYPPQEWGTGLPARYPPPERVARSVLEREIGRATLVKAVPAHLAKPPPLGKGRPAQNSELIYLDCPWQLEEMTNFRAQGEVKPVRRVEQDAGRPM